VRASRALRRALESLETSHAARSLGALEGRFDAFDPSSKGARAEGARLRRCAHLAVVAKRPKSGSDARARRAAFDPCLTPPRLCRRLGSRSKSAVIPGPQMIGAQPGWRRRKLVASILCVSAVVIFNFVCQLGLAGSMFTGRNLPPSPSLALRVSVFLSGFLVLIFASLFVSTSCALLWTMWNYREEHDLNLRSMGIPVAHVPSVDIFLPRYKEPWSLFKPTVEAALALEYPGRVEVYVLDDGADADLRARLTRELGLGTRPGLHYTVREDRRYAKAGNMQHGLRIASSDLVCCFDADMRATPDFLLRTVPHILAYDARAGRWCLSEEVGLVQTPQAFYNGDDTLALAMDGNMCQLMRVLYPAYNGLGCAPCIGTGYICQRAALDDVGGFTCGLAVEDVTTMCLITSAGWQSRFIAANLVEGLSPTTLAEFFDQRLRWTAGQIQQIWYQRFLLQRVPIKPIWGGEWDERIRRGVPGMSNGALISWLPMAVYTVIPGAAMLFMYCTIVQQILLDYHDDHVVPVFIGIVMITIIIFFCFGCIYPMGRWADVMRSIRSMYVYTPVFFTALWMLFKGEMDPARNPRFKASSEAYGGGFPPMAWMNVAFVVVAWSLLGVDVYVAHRDGAAAGMQFSIAAESLMVCWITWAMNPVFIARACPH
jgi:cellulose synthase/poly-beta-1,6-N-acetylglucosamine synthase-like glycosyltransferase